MLGGNAIFQPFPHVVQGMDDAVQFVRSTGLFLISGQNEFLVKMTDLEIFGVLDDLVDMSDEHQQEKKENKHAGAEQDEDLGRQGCGGMPEESILDVPGGGLECEGAKGKLLALDGFYQLERSLQRRRAFNPGAAVGIGLLLAVLEGDVGNIDHPENIVELDLYRLLVQAPDVVGEGVKVGLFDRCQSLDDIFFLRRVVAV